MSISFALQTISKWLNVKKRHHAIGTRTNWEHNPPFSVKSCTVYTCVEMVNAVKSKKPAAGGKKKNKHPLNAILGAGIMRYSKSKVRISGISVGFWLWSSVVSRVFDNWCWMFWRKYSWWAAARIVCCGLIPSGFLLKVPSNVMVLEFRKSQSSFDSWQCTCHYWSSWHSPDGNLLIVLWSYRSMDGY